MERYINDTLKGLQDIKIKLVWVISLISDEDLGAIKPGSSVITDDDQ